MFLSRGWKIINHTAVSRKKSRRIFPVRNYYEKIYDNNISQINTARSKPYFTLYTITLVAINDVQHSSDI